MSETVKINLTKALTSLRIISAVAGALIACFIVYMNIDARMDKLELETATFKGVMDERTRTMQLDIQIIKSVVLNLEVVPDGKSAKEGKDKGSA